MEPQQRPPRTLRNPSSPTPDLKDEIGGIIKSFEIALETLRQQHAALQAGLDRERAQAEAERARAEAAEREREAARIQAAAAEAEVRGLREALAEARRPFWRRWLGG